MSAKPSPKTNLLKACLASENSHCSWQNPVPQRACFLAISAVTSRLASIGMAERSNKVIVFFAAERKPLTERRIAAWRKKHGVTNIPFVVVGGKLDLTTGLVDATALAVTVSDLEAKSGHECVLIILDTVTRTFGPGDQHQSREMSKYIQSVDALTRATGAHVAAIHHSPWSDDRGKGAIDLDGAVDVSFVVNVRGTGLAKQFTLKCTGSNDGEEGVITSFMLESVAVGTDADGNVTTAPVVVQPRPPWPMAATSRAILPSRSKSLEQAIADHGERVPDKLPAFQMAPSPFRLTLGVIDTTPIAAPVGYRSPTTP